MPRGSKKRKAEAKKKQENRPNNHSPSSTGSNAVNKEDTKRSDERQSVVVRVEKEPRIEESMKPSRMNGEPTGKSDNGGGSSSSSSGNSSDDEVSGTKSSLTAEDISSVEEMENVQSDSEKIPLLVEKVKNESLLEDNEKSPNKVGDKVGTSVERNKEGVVQSDNRAEQEKDSTVTEKKRHHGEVAVDCLRCFRGPEDSSRRACELLPWTFPEKDLNREGSLNSIQC